MRHRTIKHLDGRMFATAGFTHDGGDVWAWVSETIAQELECTVDAVAVIEDEDRGDTITVDGIPCYLLC